MTTDTPTPETDSAAGFIIESTPFHPQDFEYDTDGNYVATVFARRLERERDEARRELAGMLATDRIFDDQAERAETAIADARADAKQANDAAVALLRSLKESDAKLTAAKNEIARLNGMTGFVCQCGGTPECVAELERQLDIARRDAGLYCATLDLSARKLGCDPHMVDNATEKLLAEVDRLREDKARLDWLEVNITAASRKQNVAGNLETVTCYDLTRAAIDAAMKEGK